MKLWFFLVFTPPSFHLSQILSFVSSELNSSPNCSVNTLATDTS